MANPDVLAHNPESLAIPYAIAALVPVIGLGAWAYEATSDGKLDIKSDVLWGVLFATICYLGFFFF